MTDCANVEMREMLPELLHGSRSPASRARVAEHVAACADCAAELELLRLARDAMASVPVPVVETATIVAALPRPRATGVPRPALRRSPVLLRLAAAVSFISLGGISVAVARSYFSEAGTLAIDSVVATGIDVRPRSVGAPPGGSTPQPAPMGEARGLALHASLSELDDAALESLLGALDEIEAAPLAEPEFTPGGRALASSTLGS